ncbi:hypothetical protein [Clostridium butyricum]|uniref:hypothetical protein n=1 Tax=Clostridium butyricum TaxID=1492 RepID=UPI000AE6D512|nr:hypothetical protein [Clostridium butyricum]
MNSFQKFITLFFPTRDVKILELRRINKEQGIEICELKEKIEQINKDEPVKIQLYD